MVHAVAAVAAVRVMVAAVMVMVAALVAAVEANSATPHLQDHLHHATLAD